MSASDREGSAAGGAEGGDGGRLRWVISLPLSPTDTHTHSLTHPHTHTDTRTHFPSKRTPLERSTLSGASTPARGGATRRPSFAARPTARYPCSPPATTTTGSSATATASPGSSSPPWISSARARSVNSHTHTCTCSLIHTNTHTHTLSHTPFINSHRRTFHTRTIHTRERAHLLSLSSAHARTHTLTPPSSFLRSPPILSPRARSEGSPWSPSASGRAPRRPSCRTKRSTSGAEGSWASLGPTTGGPGSRPSAAPQSGGRGLVGSEESTGEGRFDSRAREHAPCFDNYIHNNN